MHKDGASIEPQLLRGRTFRRTPFRRQCGDGHILFAKILLLCCCRDVVLIQLRCLFRLRSHTLSMHTSFLVTKRRWQRPLRRSLRTYCSSSSTCFGGGAIPWATRRALLSCRCGDEVSQLRAFTCGKIRRQLPCCNVDRSGRCSVGKSLLL